MRVLWLPEVLRAAGLTVHEYQGWRTRGLESFGPILGIVVHHTASSLTSKDADEVYRLAVTGSLTASPPISQLYMSRSGEWWVLASGTCTGVRTGIAGPLIGKGDDSVLQIEAQHAGGVEPWTTVQYTSYARGCAALADKLGIDVSYVIGHKEHQPGQKVDPTFDMAQFRRDVAALMNGDDDMTPEQEQILREIRDSLRVAPWQYKNADAAAAAKARGEDYPDMHAVVWDTKRRVDALAAGDAKQVDYPMLRQIIREEVRAALAVTRLDPGE